MFVGVLQVTLSIPGAYSLKDKRRVVKSILERLRHKHAVSAAEVTDLDVWNRAGLGIAFNAKPVVQQAADTAVSVPYLDAILFVLGIRREDIEAADSDEGVEGLSVPVDGLPPV